MPKTKMNLGKNWKFDFYNIDFILKIIIFGSFCLNIFCLIIVVFKILYSKNKDDKNDKEPYLVVQMEKERQDEHDSFIFSAKYIGA